jgi:hypothetical protein
MLQVRKRATFAVFTALQTKGQDMNSLFQHPKDKVHKAKVHKAKVTEAEQRTEELVARSQNMLQQQRDAVKHSKQHRGDVVNLFESKKTSQKQSTQTAAEKRNAELFARSQSMLQQQKDAVRAKAFASKAGNEKKPLDKLFETKAAPKSRIHKSKAFSKLLAQQKAMLMQQKQALDSKVLANKKDGTLGTLFKSNAPPAETPKAHQLSAAEKRTMKLVARSQSMLQQQKDVTTAAKAEGALEARSEVALQEAGMHQLFKKAPSQKKARTIKSAADKRNARLLARSQSMLQQQKAAIKSHLQNQEVSGDEFSSTFKRKAQVTNLNKEDSPLHKRPVPRGPTTTTNGLPTWMSKEDAAEILHAKAMQEALLKSMSGRVEAATQIGETQKKQNILKMFGHSDSPSAKSAPSKGAPLRHQRAVAEFDAAVENADKNLGESADKSQRQINDEAREKELEDPAVKQSKNKHSKKGSGEPSRFEHVPVRDKHPNNHADLQHRDATPEPRPKGRLGESLQTRFSFRETAHSRVQPDGSTNGQEAAVWPDEAEI